MPTIQLIQVSSGGSSQKEQRFSKDRVRLGRAPENDLSVDDPSGKNQVSRAHAELFIEDGVLHVKDLGSRAGTWVDGEKIDASKPVGTQTVLRLGADGPGFKAAILGPSAAAPAQGEKGEKGKLKKLKKAIGESTLVNAIALATQKTRDENKSALQKIMLGALAGMVCVGALTLLVSYKSTRDIMEIARKDAEKLVADQQSERERYQNEVEKLTVRIAQLTNEISDRDSKIDELKNAQDAQKEEGRSIINQTEKRVSELRKELARNQADLKRAAALAQGDWATVVERAKGSIFLCSVGYSDGTSGIATAFAITEDGLLATNAHVVEMYNPKEKTVKFAGVLQNGTGKIYDVKKTSLHPRYDGTPRSPDVGLLWVDTRGEKFMPLALATENDLRRLGPGVKLGTMGFPGELWSDYFAGEFDRTNFRLKGTVAATFKEGVISRLTNFKREVGDFKDSVLVQHATSLTAGTSGSPLFTIDGKVVAVNNASLDYSVEVVAKGGGDRKVTKRTKDAAEISFGIRIDELEELTRKPGK